MLGLKIRLCFWQSENIDFAVKIDPSTMVTLSHLRNILRFLPEYGSRNVGPSVRPSVDPRNPRAISGHFEGFLTDFGPFGGIIGQFRAI